MARGKYAVRTANRIDANERIRVTLVENQRLREQLGEVRTLRERNEQLRSEVRRLRTDVKERSSDEVRKLRREVLTSQIDQGKLWVSFLEDGLKYSLRGEAALQQIAVVPHAERTELWWTMVRVVDGLFVKGGDKLPEDSDKALAYVKLSMHNPQAMGKPSEHRTGRPEWFHRRIKEYKRRIAKVEAELAGLDEKRPAPEGTGR